MALSRETGIPLVATNDCHYLTHSDAHAQEVLLCIQTGKTMSDTHRMKFATDQFFFKTAEEMARVFGEIPEALERTVAIAERCNVKIDAVQNSFPDFQVPEGHTVDTLFRGRRPAKGLPRACRSWRRAPRPACCGKRWRNTRRA